MNKEYILTLLKKAAWAALYGALASLAVTQTVNAETFMIAGVTALARAGIAFFTTIQDAMTKKTNKSYGFGGKNWKEYL